MRSDLEQLRLLAIFHHVLAGIAALFACFPLLHFGLGLAFARGWVEADDPDAGRIGLVLMVVAGVLILLGWSFAVALFFAGRNLARARRRSFCLVVAGLSCLFMPLGTILGVYSILTLTRESVIELFEGAGPPAGSPAQAG